MPQAQTLRRGKAGARAGGRPVPAWSAAPSAARGAPSRRTAPPPTVPAPFPCEELASAGERGSLQCPLPSSRRGCTSVWRGPAFRALGALSPSPGGMLPPPLAFSVAARPAPDVVQAAFQVSPKVLRLLSSCAFSDRKEACSVLRSFICPTRSSLV